MRIVVGAEEVLKACLARRITRRPEDGQHRERNEHERKAVVAPRIKPASGDVDAQGQPRAKDIAPDAA